PPLERRLVGEVVNSLENERPAPQPRRQRRLPGSHPTHRAEASRQKVPIDLPRQPHQRMAKVDDLLEKRAKQVVLAIVARLAHRSPPPANLALQGITSHPNREIPNRKKPGMHTRLSCKIDYLLRSNHRDRSIASSFFTNDYLSCYFWIYDQFPNNSPFVYVFLVCPDGG